MIVKNFANLILKFLLAKVRTPKSSWETLENTPKSLQTGRS